MAGVTIPGVTFDAANFRTQIKLTMGMGMPEDPNERLTWRWNPVNDYVQPDPVGDPYDWSEAPTTTTPGNPDAPGGSKQVDYALQFLAAARGRGETATDIGTFDQGSLVVTLLDVDYEQIKTADYATIGNVDYEIDFSAPPEGLFTVTVYTIYLRARDQA